MVVWRIWTWQKQSIKRFIKMNLMNASRNKISIISSRDLNVNQTTTLIHKKIAFFYYSISRWARNSRAKTAESRFYRVYVVYKLGMTIAGNHPNRSAICVTILKWPFSSTATRIIPLIIKNLCSIFLSLSFFDICPNTTVVWAEALIDKYFTTLRGSTDRHSCP